MLGKSARSAPKKIRICIPIDFKPQGGGFYFLQLIERYFQQIGWRVTREIIEKYDVLFTNHWMTPRGRILKAIRSNPSVRIIQRIDGAAQDYGRDAEADIRQSEVNDLADLTIFQSQYARFATRQKFTVIKQDGPVIFNPVDTILFSPDGPRQNLTGQHRVVCVSWSTNQMKGFAQIYKVSRQNPNIDFFFCGNFLDAPRLPNVHSLGVLARDELAAIYRSCQVLLTFSKNEACPNHVLEALASGLPVLYEDSGAMSEIVGDCGVPITVESFQAKFDELRSDLPQIAKRARRRATELFQPSIIFPKYRHAIEGTLMKAPHVPLPKRLVTAWTEVLSR